MPPPSKIAIVTSTRMVPSLIGENFLESGMLKSDIRWCRSHAGHRALQRLQESEEYESHAKRQQ